MKIVCSERLWRNVLGKASCCLYTRCSTLHLPYKEFFFFFWLLSQQVPINGGFFLSWRLANVKSINRGSFFLWILSAKSNFVWFDKPNCSANLRSNQMTSVTLQSTLIMVAMKSKKFFFQENGQKHTLLLKGKLLLSTGTRLGFYDMKESRLIACICSSAATEIRRTLLHLSTDGRFLVTFQV